MADHRGQQHWNGGHQYRWQRLKKILKGSTNISSKDKHYEEAKEIATIRKWRYDSDQGVND